MRKMKKLCTFYAPQETDMGVPASDLALINSIRLDDDRRLEREHIHLPHTSSHQVPSQRISCNSVCLWQGNPSSN